MHRILVAALLLTACSGRVRSNGVVGTYVLRTINGHPLPTRVPDGAGAETWKDGMYALRADGSYDEWRTVAYTDANASANASANVAAHASPLDTPLHPERYRGAYVLVRSAIHFDSHDVAVMANDGASFVLVVAGADLRYERQ
jgi:hypothetical protein